jgi:hypothetical protein
LECDEGGAWEETGDSSSSSFSSLRFLLSLAIAWAYGARFQVRVSIDAGGWGIGLIGVYEGGDVPDPDVNSGLAGRMRVGVVGN